MTECRRKVSRASAFFPFSLASAFRHQGSVYQGVEGLYVQEAGGGLAGQEDQGDEKEVKGRHPAQHRQASDVEAVRGQQGLAHVVQPDPCRAQESFILKG